MKTTTKMALGAAAVMLFSSTVAGVTTYSMMKGEKENSGSFTEMFSPNPNVKLASMSATEAQPVDLTQAAELSLHAVVHIKSTQNVATRLSVRRATSSITSSVTVTGVHSVCVRNPVWESVRASSSARTVTS